MTTPVPGIDISTWDGDPAHVRTLDWSAYHWPFTYIKVSEGTVIDPLFARQWAAAEGHTLRGAYHFFHPEIDPKVSAWKAIDYLDGDLGELPPALDIEVTNGRTDTLERARSWLAWFEELTGVRPLIYSRPNFLRDELHCERYPYLANYKAWLAEYHFDKLTPESARVARLSAVLDGTYPITFPAPPAPIQRVSFYQWTALGTPAMVPGYYQGADGKKEIDLNFYHGSLQDLYAEFGIEPVTYPPQGEPMSYIFSITPTGSLGCKVRPEPDTGNTALSVTLPFGKFAYGNRRLTIAEDKWETIDGVEKQVNKAGDIWLEVLEVNGAILTAPAYIAEIHLGTRVATIKQIGTLPTEPPSPTDDIVITQTFASAGYSLAASVVSGDTITTTLKPKTTGLLR